MFTQLEEREVVTSGIIESNPFTIKANGKAFRVLIDGLYSDKIKSIIRELWSNAYDSHIEAGRGDQPFDCQLPTWDSLAFRVRDYGVSLSHDGVMKLYTTVFESTKEDSNAVVGKLGLGSKSPFAYTDTFTVTTWKDGEKCVYSAYIGYDHVPTISLLGRESSDEPDGLEVAFPVRNADIDAFVEAASRVALGFDVKPNTFSIELEPHVDEVLYEGEGWKLYKSFDSSLRAQARQGCVIYPIDSHAVNGATDSQRQFLQSALFMDFAIGELEITASREGLGYDEQTCKNIIARLEIVEREVIEKFEASFTCCKTLWEATIQANVLRHAHIPGPINSCLESLHFKGHSLRQQLSINVPCIRKISSSVLKGYRRRNSGGWEGNQNCRVTPGSVSIFYHDTRQRVPHWKERIKEHYNTQYPRPDDVLFLRGDPTTIAFKRALVELGRPPQSAFIDLASLPAPTSDYKRSKVKAKILDRCSRNRWEECDIDVAAGGVYVMLERKEPQKGFGSGPLTKTDNYDIRAVYDALIKIGAIASDCPLFGIPKTLKSITNKDGWQSLWDLAKQVVDAQFDPATAGQLEVLTDFIDDFESTPAGHVIEHWHGVNYVPEYEEAPAHRLMLTYSELMKRRDDALKVQPIVTLAKLIGVGQAAQCDSPDLGSLVTEFKIAYPFVTAFADNVFLNDNRLKALLDYVNLVDKCGSITNTVTAIPEESF